MSDPISWLEFRAYLDSAQTVLLTSHIRPDCDAVGSELGMARVLEKMGKQVSIVNGQATPPNIGFIDPSQKIRCVESEDPQSLREAYDVHMILDTSAWVQLGGMGDVFRETRAQRIVLDHHQSSDELDAAIFRDTNAEATGCLVVRAAEAWGVELDAEAARPLFAAIATDTGWFRFPSASENTYRIASKLIEAGAQPSEIYGQLYERETLGRLKLRGQVLARTEAELDGRLVHTYIASDDFAETGAVPSDTEDLVNLTLAIAGTEFAVIFVEQQAGGVKISFRSRCGLDCSALAGEFDGGGHKAAAGAFLATDLMSARERVLTRVREAMRDIQ